MCASKSVEQAKEDGWDNYLNQLEKESARGLALVGAAILDDRLCDLLKSFLIPKPEKVKQLLGAGGPLGTLRSRITAAYCLGLVAEDQYHTLLTLNEIRNKFAHDLDSESFDSQRVRKLCSKLVLPEPLRQGKEFESAPDRWKFLLNVVLLAFELDMSRRHIKNQRRITPQKKDMPRWQFTTK